ncbi:MAG: hypothetical protein IT233_00270 [Bacteroidia bacterium]|nr:hypothetical protein [Bacteroidia bacterium]
MKSKYLILKDREAISEREIAEQMDFNRQLKYTTGAKSGWLKWMAGTVAVSGIVAGLLLWGPERSSLPLLLLQDNFTDSVPWPQAPDTVFTFDGGKGGVYRFRSGSQIHVPAGAFMGENGQPFAGPVQLRYREFHGPKDFFLSGIPMTYDSAGTRYHFESGGMIEILAFDGDRPLQLRPGNSVKVEMVSVQPGNHFNSYFLDSRSGRWEYLGKDTAGIPEPWKNTLDSLLTQFDPVSLRKQLMNSLDEQVKDREELKKNIPPSPFIPRGNELLLVVDLDTVRFPEWAGYRNLKFAVAPEEKQFAKMYSTKTWRNVRMKSADSAGWCVLEFTDWTQKITVKARPVLGEKNIKKANAILEKYHQDLRRREKKLTADLNMLRELNARYVGEVEFDNTEGKKLQEWQKLVTANTQTVMRVFNVERFGIYNSDCPKLLPKGMEIIASFKDQTGKPLKLGTVYLVEQGRNMMFTYYGDTIRSFRYNPKTRNQLWTLTADGRIATLSAEDFKKAKPEHGACVYTLTVHPGRIGSEQDARRLLNL